MLSCYTDFYHIIVGKLSNKVVGQNLPAGFQPVGKSIQLVGRNLPTGFLYRVGYFIQLVGQILPTGSKYWGGWFASRPYILVFSTLSHLICISINISQSFNFCKDEILEQTFNKNNSKFILNRCN